MPRQPLSDEVVAKIHAQVDALPPLTDDQLDAIADILVQIELGSE